MKAKFIPLLLAGVVTVGLSGCVINVGEEGYSQSNSNWQHDEQRNRELIANLQPGMSIDAVKSKMGVADFVEAFSRDEGLVEVLFYRTQRVDSDGRTSKDECTALVFRQGALIGWGERAYSAI
ncbi:DUF3192 domain-containing protein [Shewanella sp. GXUN23E]|uniref:DUF3192 domain-containing protein n=1 Tax=Shewanella sp. GXUN23E TaxID=3422498 RepID=UPI003D7E249B